MQGNFLGNKGFFNAISRLANDGLNREIVVNGSHSINNRFINATATLKIDNHEYTLKNSKKKSPDFNGLQLMAENAIKLIKNFVAKTSNISKEALNEKATGAELAKISEKHGLEKSGGLDTHIADIFCSK